MTALRLRKVCNDNLEYRYICLVAGYAREKGPERQLTQSCESPDGTKRLIPASLRECKDRSIWYQIPPPLTSQRETTIVIAQVRKTDWKIRRELHSLCTSNSETEQSQGSGDIRYN